MAMTHTPDDRDPAPQPTEGRSPPPSVRGSGVIPAGADSENGPLRRGPEAPPSGRKGRGGRGRSRRKPTSARAMARTDGPPSPIDPDTSEASFECDDEAWVVRVLGTARGSGSGATPLILLGFWKADASHGDPVRETLTVGRTLSELSSATLERALMSSKPFAPGPGPARSAGARDRPRR